MTGFITDTEEQAMLRRAVGDIADSYGREWYLERSRSHGGIAELWTDLGEAGFLGLHLPEEYGGGGAGMVETSIVIEELAAHGMPILNTVISTGIVGSILARHGSEEQRRAWLPGMSAGTGNAAFALTEPDSGSNSHVISTTVSRTSAGLVLNGSKYYISAIDEARGVLVTARNADAEPRNGRQPLTQVLLPLPTEGVTWSRIPTAVVTSDQQFTVFFDDVPLTDDMLIGDPTRGLTQLFSGLNPERILAAAISCGIGRFAVDRAADYARSREVWGVPIGAHQGVAHPLAQCYAEVEMARLGVRRAAELHDSGQDPAEAANIAKMAAADASLHALDEAIQIHGGNGLSSEYGLSDLWFAARMMKTAPVTKEMVLNYVAQNVLNLPRSY